MANDQALQTLPFQQGPNGCLHLRFNASPGLYQFSIIADAEEFDWGELYFDLHLFGNQGQRTGPWDFDLREGNKPLIPSYWVSLNGERIGLWFFARVSLEDIADKQFRGRIAFHLRKEGENLLTFTPYRPMRLRWISARLEPDPEDNLESALPLCNVAACSLAPWGESTYWEELRHRLTTTHALYATPLRQGFDWVCRRSWHSPDQIALLLACWKLEHRPEALELALRAIDKWIELPHWGNPKEDGYSHDGDMGAAFTLRALTLAYHAVGDAMERERRERLLAKLTLQGNRFLAQALLNRDYWGGSVIQDHGWRAIFVFGAAALNLIGILPEAQLWASWVIPRAQRGLSAMPRDGVIPLSSYGSPILYLNDLVDYRNALLSHRGKDLLEHISFRRIVDYILTVLRPEDGFLIVSGAEASQLVGGNAFLNQMASKYQDRRAAFLQRNILERRETPSSHSQYEEGYYIGALHGFLSFDPCVEPEPVIPLEASPRLSFFEDSGLAHYRDDSKGVILSVRCGPWCGYHAYQNAQGPCDRMEAVPGAGHFILYLDAKPRLTTPDIGYRMHSFMRSCLLIDDRGQIGDIGYPMSIPSKLHNGEEIETVQWNSDLNTGKIRLKLHPAYPKELGVTGYTREFLIRGDRTMICRDHIVLNRPRKLSWLFQGSRATGVALEEEQCGVFGRDPALRLRPQATGVELKASLHETDVVWSYTSANNQNPFSHIRYDSITPTAQAAVDFIFTW